MERKRLAISAATLNLIGGARATLESIARDDDNYSEAYRRYLARRAERDLGLALREMGAGR